MAVIPINVFTVSDGREERLVHNWKIAMEHFKKRHSFIETHLHRNAGVGNGTFELVNYAKWESAGAWRSTHKKYKPTEYAVPGVTGHPAIFEIVIHVVGETASLEHK